MSHLMMSIGDIQRSAQAREDEANIARKTAEEKFYQASDSMAKLREEISALKHGNSTLEKSLEVVKNDLTAARQSIDILRDERQAQNSELTAHLAHLRVETELRTRAEEKEIEERRERIALSAQMVAMTKEHARMETQLREEKENSERVWKEKIEEQHNVCGDLRKTILALKEDVCALEGERSSLKEALNEKKNMADAQVVEENGRLRGEINVLKDRLVAAGQQAVSNGVANAEQLRQLQQNLREAHVERRRYVVVI